MHELLFYGDSRLRISALPVVDFSSDLKNFTDFMVLMLNQSKALGLAATQINDRRSAIVVRNENPDISPYVFINPTITKFSTEKSSDGEGCLSFPGVNFVIERSTNVSLEAVDINGVPIIIEDISGLTARIIQHEVDHINGLLFSDRLSAGQKLLVNNKLKKIAKYYGTHIQHTN